MRDEDQELHNSKFTILPDESILTPHYSELSNILKISIDEIKNNTIAVLKNLSKYLSKRILVLKGPNTIIVNGKGEMYFINYSFDRWAYAEYYYISYIYD